jgi:hypothetical protein
MYQLCQPENLGGSGARNHAESSWPTFEVAIA